ncbi:hypothetical protein ONV78_09600 [Hahella sp. CR1]|uniref:hypothetical protein n=1 Tax=Hahella sp. CR1 TaxID=2992807 RepID=UPI00244277FF|nr:hypothetical protein [Hahella sp. CR1]MDG9667985.1 hypothetical protein [Hahella sp. CR1]
MTPKTLAPMIPRLSIQEVALRKKQALYFSSEAVGSSNAPADQVAQLQVEAMCLGFVFSDNTLQALAAGPGQREEVFLILQKLVGADKVWRPMYPNFPLQVFNASECELFFNALAHYRTHGQWLPEYVVNERMPVFEKVKLKPIGLLAGDALLRLFHDLLAANGSLAPIDKACLRTLLEYFDESLLLPQVPDKIPFKETLCQLAADAYALDKRALASTGVSNATDVLRIATHLSGGDISLATNTRFKLSKAQRKWLVGLLEPVVNETDLRRHKGKWKRLFHCLHIGTFASAPKTNALAARLREDQLQGDNRQVEAALEAGEANILVRLLSRKPGEFARRLDHLLRRFSIDVAKSILEAFLQKIDAVDTRVLVQLLGHFAYRQQMSDEEIAHGEMGAERARIFLPKGQIARAKVLHAALPEIDIEILQRLLIAIRKELTKRFSRLPPLGKVWIDPALRHCPTPLQMRSASEGLKIVPRGARLEMGDKNTLRFFLHWVGHDLDLSASFLTEDLKYHSSIAYYALRGKAAEVGYRAAHSGDIVEAPEPDGACEFIDIDLGSISDPSIRYIGMDVRVFSGPSLAQQNANAGWMMRRGVGEGGKVFDATTVEQRIAISAATRTCLAAFFDIKQREVIWLDLVGSSESLHRGNNAVSNASNIEQMLMAALNFRQLSLYELLSLHAQARGDMHPGAEGADMVFGRDMVFQYEQILAHFLQ